MCLIHTVCMARFESQICSVKNTAYYLDILSYYKKSKKRMWRNKVLLTCMVDQTLNWEGHCLRNPQKRSQTKTPTMIKAMHIVVWNLFHCLLSFFYSLKLAYTLSSMSFATHRQDCPLVVPYLLSLIWNLSVSFILFFRSFYHCFTLLIPINIF